MASELKPAINTLVEVIGRVEDQLTEIKGKLHGIQEAITEGFEKLLDAIQENTRAQAELKLLDHMADVHRVEPRIKAEQQRIEREKQDLDERLSRIAERYASRHEELNEKASERIRDLGEHIFEIEEDEYEAEVEHRLTEHVTDTWSDLATHNELTREGRSDQLQRAAEEASAAVNAFLGRRERLLSDIESCRTNVAVGDQASRIQVPFYVVRIERDGVSERVVVPPARLSAENNDWHSATLEELPGFRAQAEQLSTRDVPMERTDRDGATLAAEAGAFGTERLFGLVSYTDEFRKAVPEQVPVYEEVSN